MCLSLQLDFNTNWIVCYLRKGRHAMEMEKNPPNSTTQKSFPALCTLMFQQPHRQAGNWYVCSKADFEDQNSSKLHRDLKDHKVLRELLFLIKSSTTPSLHAPWAALKGPWDRRDGIWTTQVSCHLLKLISIFHVSRNFGLSWFYILFYIFFKLLESSRIRRN